MRLGRGRQSDNVEDRRGMGGGAIVGGGGIGMILLLLIISFITGVNPLELFQVTDSLAPPGPSAPAGPPADDPQAKFVSQVLADTEDTWKRIFAQAGAAYREPGLVLFDGAVNSACGQASAAVGPFYCPLDEKVYLDLSFFRELDQRFGAPGDFAQAYVVAHEIGHHVQTLTGLSSRINQARQRASEAEYNALSVRQ
jgi:predicted metalloprotease